jgi:Fe-S-cluster-containing dehydrogenase component
MSGEGGLISSKRAGWQSQFVEYDMYTTTSKVSARVQGRSAEQGWIDACVSTCPTHSTQLGMVRAVG